MPVIIDGTLGVNAAAITTTNWNPTNLSIPGNSTIGDASSDTLTINATPTFATDITLSAGSLVGDALKINLGNSVKGYFGSHALANGGFYINSQQANHDLRLRTQGYDRITIDSSGNVGIGIASPSTTLVVSSSGGAQKRAILVSSGSGAGSPGGVYLLSATAAGGNAATYEAIGQRSDTNGASSFSGNVALGHLYTSGITTTGMSLGAIRFGGNSTGSTTADVRYSAQIIGLAESAWTNSSSQPTALLFYTGSTGVDINSSIAECGTERMRIDSTGNVGVGTNAPFSKLTVYGPTGIVSPSTGEATGVGTIRIENGSGLLSTDGGLEFKVAGDTNGYGAKIQALNSGGAQLVFANRNASATWVERMRITSDGKAMIGMNNGQSTFNVYNANGGAPATSGSTDTTTVASLINGVVGLDFGHYVNGTAWVQNRTFNNYATNYDLSLQPNGGNVGIGTSGQSAKLSVLGTAGRFSELLGNTIQVRIASSEGGWNSLIGFANNAGTFLGGVLGNGVGQAISDIRIGPGSTPGAIVIDTSGNTSTAGYASAKQFNGTVTTSGLETQRFSAGGTYEALVGDVRYRSVTFTSQTTGTIASNAGCAAGTAWIDFVMDSINSTWDCEVMVNHNSDGSGFYRASAGCIISPDVVWNNTAYSPHIHVSGLTYNFHSTMTVTAVVYDAYSNAEYTSFIPSGTGSSAHANDFWTSPNVRLRIKVTGYNSSASNGPGRISVWLRKRSSDNA